MNIKLIEECRECKYCNTLVEHEAHILESQKRKKEKEKGKRKRKKDKVIVRDKR